VQALVAIGALFTGLLKSSRGAMKNFFESPSLLLERRCSSSASSASPSSR
jgi:hypothetical protein